MYGILKIETFGNSYMVAGGLKVSEREMDMGLFESHHSVRVADFALSAVQFARTFALRYGNTLQVKVGLHTGAVISGVVGDTKPQFFLIGATVNKAGDLCASCPSMAVQASRDTYKGISAFSNTFSFKKQHVLTNGVGKKVSYLVTKARSVTGGAKSAIRR